MADGATPMTDGQSNYPVPEAFAKASNLTPEKYQELYDASIENPEAFWREQGKRLDWFKPYSIVKDVSWDKSDLHVKWYSDGELNVAYNCIDRHLDKARRQGGAYLGR